MTASRQPFTTDFAEQLCDLAVSAGEAILEVYERDDFEVRSKSDDSPLTEADLASNGKIEDGLRAMSDLPILSEESKSPPWFERRDWSRFWMVDPLDGTKEFIKRNGEFTVNIALVEDGVPVLGIVHAPALDKTYWGARGLGSFVIEDGRTRSLAVSADIGDTIVVVVSRSHLRDADRHFLERLAQRYGAADTTPTGSSLKLCLVAEGEADVYPRFGPTMEWDTAAAQCVVTEAGGIVETLDGAPVRYNKEDLLNPFFVARTPAVDAFWSSIDE